MNIPILIMAAIFYFLAMAGWGLASITSGMGQDLSQMGFMVGLLFGTCSAMVGVVK